MVFSGSDHFGISHYQYKSKSWTLSSFRFGSGYERNWYDHRQTTLCVSG